MPFPAAGGAGTPARARARPVSLRTNVVWTAVGTGAYAACQWGVLVAIARLTGPEVVGRFALGLAVTAPLFLLAGLQLRSAQVTDAAGRFRFEDYLAVRIAGMALALLAAAGFAAVSGHDRETALVVLAVAASKAIEGVSDLYYGALQREERMRPIAVSMALRGVLSVTAVAVVLWAGGGLLLALVAMGACWAAVLVLHDRPVARRAAGVGAAGRARVSLAVVGRLAAGTLPLGLVMMLVSLRVNIPRYVIEHHDGAAALGVFAALSSLLTAGNIVIGALGQSATPRLARHHFERDVAAFRGLLGKLLAIAVCVGAAALGVCAIAGEPLLRGVFGAGYAGHADVLLWLMASGVVANASSVLGYALTAARRFTVQLPIFASTTLVCAAGCAWLVPAHGLRGAAYAWGGSLVVELIAIGAVLAGALRARTAKGTS